MSTIVIDGLISLGVVLSLWLIYSISKPIGNKKTIEHIIRFNELAKRNNLFITKKEVIGNLIMGLDGLRKKLFVLRRIDDQYDLEIINLEEIMNCSRKKIYKRMPGETAEMSEHKSFLDRIVLEFNYAGSRKQARIPFYTSGINELTELPDIYRKTRSWEIMLNQLLVSKPGNLTYSY